MTLIARCMRLLGMINVRDALTDMCPPSFPHDSKAVISVGQLLAITKVSNFKTKLFKCHFFALFCAAVRANSQYETLQNRKGITHTKTLLPSSTATKHTLFQ